jgi:hypothetical protein
VLASVPARVREYGCRTGGRKDDRQDEFDRFRVHESSIDALEQGQFAQAGEADATRAAPDPAIVSGECHPLR